MNDDDWDFPEGECPNVTVYESDEPPSPTVIYDHEGNPLVKKRIRLGFDLTGSEV